MTYTVRYTDDADESLTKFKKSNPIAYKKIIKLAQELHIHPREGTGHPEPLTKGNFTTYSRRITKKDRLVYDIYDDIVVVLILSMEGHYDDK
jgi:toxin YoeB